MKTFHPKLMLSLGTTDFQGKAHLMSMSHHNGVNGCKIAQKKVIRLSKEKGMCVAIHLKTLLLHYEQVKV